jgi:hypothetical protein
MGTSVFVSCASGFTVYYLAGASGFTNPWYDYPTAVFADVDRDSVPDAIDNCPSKYNPLQLDANGNAIGDVCDPTPGCGTGCGQPICEQEVDTDGDFIRDAIDNCPANCNAYQLDADGDGTGDVCDADPGCGGCGQPRCENQVDSDGDNFADHADNCPGVCNRYQMDADSDGAGDVCDATPACGGAGQSVCEAVCTP